LSSIFAKKIKKPQKPFVGIISFFKISRALEDGKCDDTRYFGITKIEVLSFCSKSGIDGMNMVKMAHKWRKE
jgi:hypothetical protein